MEKDCLFCDIAQRRTRVSEVAHTRHLIAFADQAPIRPGHLQIVPRAHHTCFDEMPASIASAMIRLGQSLARALKAEFDVPRVGFVITGNDVSHVHAHLVPMVCATDITSRRYISNADLEFSPIPTQPPVVLDKVAQSIAERFTSQSEVS